MLKLLVFAILTFSLIVPAFAGAADNDKKTPIRVAVSSNFYPTLKVLLEQNKPLAENVILSSGSTGLLYAQIKNGAPFDVFLSADAERPRLLEQQGLGFSRVTYALGELVLWPAEGSAKAVLGEYPGLLAIANPKLAPYGVAAVQSLSTFGVAADYESRLLRANNVNQAFQFIDTGNAKLGIISKAQLIAAQKKAQQTLRSTSKPDITASNIYQQFVELPITSYKPISQQLIGLHRTKQPGQTQRFIRWIMSEGIQRQLLEFGYQNDSGVAHE